VNLGNAFCDQGQHADAIPLYLRALAIDQAALGDEHPEVAMDLSNLGIVYRVQGRKDEAIALFQRAHSIMVNALGSDDPKTLTVARNLAATQVIEVKMVASPRAPPAALERRLSSPRQRKTPEEINDDMRAATEKREALLQARVDRALESTLPAGLRTPRGDSTPRRPPQAPTAEANGTEPPKLKLNTCPPVSAAAPGCATPRSAYSRASNEAAAAAAQSRAGGGAKQMLHQHIAKIKDGTDSEA